MDFRPKNLNDFYIKFAFLSSPESEGCHLWKGLVNADGYGRIKFKYKIFLAHRLSYSLNFGLIPKGLYVCHKCDIPSCVNPEHLFLGTALENNLDKINKGRDRNKSKTKCKRGHGFTKGNTYVWKNKRRCKKCHNENVKKNYWMKK